MQHILQNEGCTWFLTDSADDDDEDEISFKCFIGDVEGDVETINMDEDSSAQPGASPENEQPKKTMFLFIKATMSQG
jgi:hypothetical protein